VAKPPELSAAETELVDIQNRQQALTAALSKANSRFAIENALECHAAMQEVSGLERERGRLSRQSAELQRKIEALKPSYARSVRVAIGHHRRNAAVRVAQALRDYEAAAADLKAADKVLIAVGANPQRFAEIPFLPRIAASIQKVISECNEDLQR
jgi:predicted  nucleic acid-binding Zn-ribbon protein